MINEFQFIREIQQQIPQQNKNVIGIGDDCALVEHGRLWCTDAMVDGTHFLREKSDLADVAYKSMMINISDLAAMGGYPEHALLTLGLPEDLDRIAVNQLIDGFKSACAEYAIDIIGGDTVASSALFISVSLLGSLFRHPVLRSQARVGDFIYVSGTLGDSGIGLSIILDKLSYPVSDKEYFLARHYSPTPRVELMKYLCETAKIHAAIDISDGLGDDLLKMVNVSGKGFFLEWDQLPLSRQAIGASLDQNPRYFYDQALNGGEDYELILTSPDSLDTGHIFEATGVQLTPVGRITEAGYEIRYNDEIQDVEKAIRKFQHFEQ